LYTGKAGKRRSIRNLILLLPFFFSLPVLPLTPPTEMPEIDLREAFSAQINGNDAEAIQRYKKFFESGQESAYSRAEYAKVLSRSNLHNEAVLEASRASELDPSNPDYSVLLAIVLTRGGQKQKAALVLENSRAKFPGNPDIEFYLAENYAEAGRKNDALLHYTQVLFHLDRAGSKMPQYRSIALWKLSSIYFEQNDLDHAKFYLTRYIKYNPDRLFPRFVLGYHLMYARNNLEEARPHLEFLVAASPAQLREQGVNADLVYSAAAVTRSVYGDTGVEKLLRVLGSLRARNALEESIHLETIGMYEQSLQKLALFLKQNPENLPGRIVFIHHLERLNREDLLLGELERVSMLASHVGQHRTGLRLSLKALAILQKNDSKNLSRIKQQIAQHYESMAQYNRALLYLNESVEDGDHEGRWANAHERNNVLLSAANLMSQSSVDRMSDALALCDKIITSESEFAKAYYIRGLIRIRNESFREAAEDFTKASELLPANAAVFYFRATALYELGEFDGAVADLRKVLTMSPGFPDASNFLGYILADHGVQLDEALQLVEKAIHETPTNASYLDSMGWVYFQMGRLEEAEYHLSLASQLLDEAGAPDSIVLEHLGDLYVKMGVKARALAAYSRALTLLEEKSEKGRLTNGQARLVDSLKKKIEGIDK